MHASARVLIRVLITAAALAVLAATGARAQSEPPPGLEPIPDQPQSPPPVQSGESLEPDVRIIQREDKTITEYSLNGVVRAIKVQPAVGPAYYLVDLDGDGRLDARRSRLEPDFLIPHWVLFSW